MTLVRRARALVILAAMFLWDLLAASVHVARIVLSPRIRTHPAIIVVPVSLHSDWGVALFASLTSLTPGSTCLHVSDDRKRLYVHLLDASDADGTAARFKRIYERWLAEFEG